MVSAFKAQTACGAGPAETRRWRCFGDRLLQEEVSGYLVVHC
jgi:hypothetical protein